MNAWIFLPLLFFRLVFCEIRSDEHDASGHRTRDRERGRDAVGVEIAHAARYERAGGADGALVVVHVILRIAHRESETGEALSGRRAVDDPLRRIRLVLLP